MTCYLIQTDKHELKFVEMHVTTGPLLSCKPSSVFEMETGDMVCELNTSMTYENITVMKNGQAIMTVYPNGTNHYFSDETEKYDSTVGTSFTFFIKNVSCSDENEYTFTVEVGEGGSCYKTASLEMKGSYIILYKEKKKLSSYP